VSINDHPTGGWSHHRRIIVIIKITVRNNSEYGPIFMPFVSSFRNETKPAVEGGPRVVPFFFLGRTRGMHILS